MITLAEVDGETTIVLEKNGVPSLVSGLRRVFQGRLKCPGKSVAVGTSDLKMLLKPDISRSEAEVEVWVNDSRFPSRIVMLAK